jgi:hypothetical protein
MFKRILFFFILCYSLPSLAVPVLERTITLKLSQVKLSQVLQEIEAQASFSFSYNPSQVNTNTTVSIEVSHKSVRQTLYGLFEDKILFRAKGNYIILSPNAPKPASGQIKNEPIIIWGYVSDSLTKEKISYATVYEKQSLKSTLTNEYGYFTLVLDHTNDSIQLLIRKESFNNVNLSASPKPDLVLNIVMVKPVQEVEEIVAANNEPVFQTTPVAIKPDTLIPVTMPKPRSRMDNAFLWLTPFRSRFMLRNVQDSFNRDFQVSFVPFFGTNGLMSGSITNKVSLNIIGGFNGGSTALEAGGIFNIIRHDVRGAQVAGIFNAVGRNTTGVQAAGILNANFGNTEGLQAAGIFNNDMGTVSGIQLAGIFNNTFKETNALQVAGILNNSIGGFTGVQLAGIGNSCFNDLKGAQLAGIYNFSAKKINGLQVAGIVNAAVGEISVGQFSGILNIAGHVKRYQVGLINISDTCEGIPIGYFSFVRKGYHSLELSATEAGMLSLSFRTGVSKFHNIFSIGLPLTKAGTGAWSYGYGIGTSKELGAKNIFDIDLGYTKLNKGLNTSAPNNIYTLFLGIDRKMSKHCSLSYGITLNDYILDPGNYDYETFKDFAPYALYKNLSRYQNNFWPGVKVGLRLN